MIVELVLHHSVCDDDSFIGEMKTENKEIIDHITFEGFNSDLTMVFHITLNDREYQRRVLTEGKVKISLVWLLPTAIVDIAELKRIE